MDRTAGQLYFALARGAAEFLVLLDRTGGRIAVRPEDGSALDDARAALARTMAS
jgi:hypothetical protein